MKFKKALLPLLVLASVGLAACAPTIPQESSSTPAPSVPETSTPSTSEVTVDYSTYCKEIFGDKVTYGEHAEIKDEKNVNLAESWMAISSLETYVGRVYHCALPGKHATMHIMVGVNRNGQFSKVYLVNKAPNEYGDIVQTYVDGLNAGTTSLDDEIKNGATSSSKGVHDMIVQALAHARVNPIVEKVAVSLKETFGDKVAYAMERNKASETYANVADTWAVKNAANGELIGRTYHMALPGKHAVMHLLVGVKFDGSFAKTFLVNKAPNEYGDIVQTYVDGLNDGTISLDDEIKNGATSSSKGVNDLIKQALAHYAANPMKQFDASKLLVKVFGENVTYGELTAINDAAYANLISVATVKEGETVKGSVYVCGLLGKHATAHLLVGVNAQGKFVKAFLNEVAPNEYGKIAQEYIDGLNDGTVSLDDPIHNGATATSTGIHDMIVQAIAYANK